MTTTINVGTESNWQRFGPDGRTTAGRKPLPPHERVAKPIRWSVFSLPTYDLPSTQALHKRDGSVTDRPGPIGKVTSGNRRRVAPTNLLGTTLGGSGSDLRLLFRTDRVRAAGTRSVRCLCYPFGLREVWSGMRLLKAAILIVYAAAATAGAEPPASLAVTTSGLTRQDGFVPFYWDAREGQLLLEVARPARSSSTARAWRRRRHPRGVPRPRPARRSRACAASSAWARGCCCEQLQTTHRSGVADPERTRVVDESFPSSVLAALASWPRTAAASSWTPPSSCCATRWSLPRCKRGASRATGAQDTARSALELERTRSLPAQHRDRGGAHLHVRRPAAGGRRRASRRPHHEPARAPHVPEAARARATRRGRSTRASASSRRRYRDHTAPFTEPIERYLVSRWRLAKKDPARRSPSRWSPSSSTWTAGCPSPSARRCARRRCGGTTRFEEAGFKNALVVRDLPEGATFLDARYSGIEWINRAERAWSIGDFQVDPRTGEILHAVARIDSHRRRTTSRMWQNMRRRRSACLAGDAPDARSCSRATPAWTRSRWCCAAALSLRPRGGPHPGPDAQLGRHDVRLGLGDGLPRGPNIAAPKDGGLDLSDAYPTDIGSYDRLMIRGATRPTRIPRRLDRIVREGYARGDVYPLDGDPRWAEYDWGADPVAWLRTTQAVRRVILDRFGAGSARAGRAGLRPAGALQPRLPLPPLRHPGRPAVRRRPVPDERARGRRAGAGRVGRRGQAAGGARPAARSAGAREPRRPRPHRRRAGARALGHAPRTRERFASEAGDTFSPL